jgi:hypothetical protein
MMVTRNVGFGSGARRPWTSLFVVDLPDDADPSRAIAALRDDDAVETVIGFKSTASKGSDETRWLHVRDVGAVDSTTHQPGPALPRGRSKSLREAG